MFLFRKRIKEILEPFDGVQVKISAKSVNYLGQESKGLGQVRGNGCLVLTESELFYEMWAPKRILRIPLNNIKSVENPPPKWHLKKSKGRPLLKVHFINDEGKEDSAAWIVPYLDQWIQLVSGL